ncbi:SusC/RagA family protein [Siphonobacter sp. BAB-5405]|uniref:SusC/RagA family TonB-linked outer membrane protein n=1 Tax=Siphonobacter sp. BAB-5405 TaxID=1864825 RepID=UPI000C8004CE|nr:SusC/RagA family TonB-linked outer membrane protein [Siphonobacter sp. BAB-5405]PMD98693.1 SusC/RagA family protein [Siphonobacter sp. BAB-5405]
MKISFLCFQARFGRLFALLWLMSLSAMAQNITGKVTNAADGSPLPGVTVVEKGSTKGTVTDAQGQYTLNAASEATLVFSYLGFVPQEIPLGGRTTVDVVLKEDTKSLNEVVVTALGIQRDKKALGYSVTEVKGSEFTQAREMNVANALSGKVAGVNASGMSTGPGGSSRVVIRGNGSLNGNSQPLYVINGMPIDNSTPGGSPQTGAGGLNVDRGDGIGGINPDDIESISVLKGGTAAALYGSRAANGVILITTKKGVAQKGIGVDFNSTFTAETPSVFPKWQYEYGQGDQGRKPATQQEALDWGRRSFGAKMDGQPYTIFNGTQQSYSPQRNNINNFYELGTTFSNTLALSGGSENINFRFSLANMDSKSIQPNSKFNRKVGNLNVNAKLTKNLSLEAVAQYNIEEATNRPSAGDATGNPNWAVYMLANTVDIRQLSPGYDATGREIQWNETPYASNSYFVVNRYKNNDTKNRFIGQFNLQYNFLDNLYIRGSVSRDFYNYKYTGIIPSGTVYTLNAAGEYHDINSSVSETNGMLTAHYNTKLGNDFHLTALAGGNMRKFLSSETYIDGTQFIVPNFYSYTNLNNFTTRPYNPKIATNSLFGSLDLDYKGFAFLTLTGRQDWFSTLSPSNNSLFYPSVGGSFVLSQAVELPQWVSFAKARASWAQVGAGSVDPFITNQSYGLVQGGHDGRPLQQVTQYNGVNLITNASLRPLTSTTYEVGIDAKFFNNRLGIDLTYYDRKTTDDIVRTTVSRASGYNEALLNVGALSNRGVEALITYNPIKNKNFSWNVSYNMAYNRSEVMQLVPGVNTLELASSVGGWAFVHHQVGRPFGVIKGYTMDRDANGNVIFNTATGYQQRSALKELGQGVPPWTMGLNNTFTYKNFSLDVLIDGKFGNKIFSTMDVYATRFGLHQMTLPGRENGLPVSGVTSQGDSYSRTVPVKDLRLYYDNLKNYTDLFLYDASFVKLRQIVLNYAIPVKNSKIFRGASVSLVARNPFILYKKTDNFDPEASYTNSNAQGFEAFALPRTRSMGVNLMLKF